MIDVNVKIVTSIADTFCCEDYECGQCRQNFTVSGSIHEYPIGAYDFEHIEVKS